MCHHHIKVGDIEMVVCLHFASMEMVGDGTVLVVVVVVKVVTIRIFGEVASHGDSFMLTYIDVF